MKTIAEIRRDNLMILIGEQGSTSPRYRNRLRDRSIHRKDFPKIAISARHQHGQQAVFFRLWKIFRVSLLTWCIALR